MSSVERTSLTRVPALGSEVVIPLLDQHDLIVVDDALDGSQLEG
ncbi:MAG TPA: hypothetical protein VFJ82_12895 [Longimicrobium sp.]|nr:hypothetical protein [Longimicrobium sp.]